MKCFFETIPPGGKAEVTEGIEYIEKFSPSRYRISTLAINLHCDVCGGVRNFQKTRNDDMHFFADGKSYPIYEKFHCRDCLSAVKLYAVLVNSNVGAMQRGWRLEKLAERPDFGAPTPAKVITLVGLEKDYYLKGRRSENQGLGIAAFSYYRRVVENQKERIFDEIIRAARRIDAPAEMIADFEAAKKETQFSTAIEQMKHGVPQALLINRHNPLTLLHTALSDGMHAKTDEECLGLATSIRLVLTDLAERLGSVLKEQADLDAAVSKLLAVKAKKPVVQ